MQHAQRGTRTINYKRTDVKNTRPRAKMRLLARRRRGAGARALAGLNSARQRDLLLALVPLGFPLGILACRRDDLNGSTRHIENLVPFELLQRVEEVPVGGELPRL